MCFNYKTSDMQTTTATRRPPRKRRKTRWVYGRESSFKLLVFSSGNWLQPLYSHDVPNKAIAKGTRAEFSDAQKIERLQQLFAKGGTRGNSFNPTAVEFAAILPNFGKMSDAVARWSPHSGWQTVQPKAPSISTAPNWRLWLAGEPNHTFGLDLKSGEFQQFAADFPAKRPDLVARFADLQSGELPQAFLIAAYLGEVARRLQGGQKYSRAYIYRGESTQPVLRVDLASGRLCGIGQGGGWVSPEFFFSL
jgi:hypothetical protein